MWLIVISGGDNIFQPVANPATLDLQDEVLTRYIESESPVSIGIEGRIRNVNGTKSNENETLASGGVPSATDGGAQATETPSTGSLLQLSNMGFIGIFVTFALSVALF